MIEGIRTWARNFLAEEKIPQGFKGEMGWAESQLYAENIPKYNPDELIGRKGTGIYRKMMTDEQVKAVVKFKRDAITSRNFVFTLEDERVSDGESEKRVSIYDEMIDQVSGSFKDGLNFIMKASWQGFSMTEKVFDIFEFQGTPYMGLRKLSPKPFDTFEFFSNEFGEITKTEQTMDADRQQIDLEKFVYFVQNPDMDQHYGQSELREAYRSWYSKEVIIRLYNMYMERMSGGFLVMKPEGGTSITVGSPEFNALKAILDNAQSTTGILLPGGMDLSMETPGSTDQFEKAITMHDLQIAKALLVPNLLGISHTGQTGAFAQSQTQLEAFLWTLDADALRLQDALNEQIFDPLSRLNFADGIGPRIQFKAVSEQKKHDLLKVWSELASKGAVEITETDEQHIRDMLDFPEKGEPIKKPADPLTDPPRSAPSPGGQTDDEPLPDETVMGQTVKIVSDAALTRATKRVSFQVLDRKSTQLVEQSSASVASSLAEMVASLSLQILEDKMGTPAATREPKDLKFNGHVRNRARKATVKALNDAWDLGLKHSLDEMSKARGEAFKADMARIDTNAQEFLQNNGFRIVGDMSASIMRVVQSILANAVKFSWTPKETVRRVYDRLTVDGMVFVEANAEATGRTVAEIYEVLGEQPKSIHRIKTVVRTTAFEALNEARYSAFTDPSLDGFVEALEYSAVLDSRTTDICSHLDSRVFPVDAPEWDAYRPPNHFNCRSVLVPVTVVDTDVTGKDREGDSRWSRSPRVDPQKGFGGDT